MGKPDVRALKPVSRAAYYILLWDIMNERIREFAEQATRYYDRLGMEIPFAQPDFEKFAELIVKECNKCANQYINDCGEVSSLPEYILETHFGIK